MDGPRRKKPYMIIHAHSRQEPMFTIIHRGFSGHVYLYIYIHMYIYIYSRIVDRDSSQAAIAAEETFQEGPNLQADPKSRRGII